MAIPVPINYENPEFAAFLKSSSVLKPSSPIKANFPLVL